MTNIALSSKHSMRGADAPWIFDASTPARRKVLDLARRVAPSSCPILILGPTGVGKEVLANDIHQSSPRRGAPFISVNCAAFTSTLFESSFFGHVRGAFTGAMADKPGLVELANGGTLFLDEVGELPPDTQAKLLRFLAQGTYWPVGGTSERRADVRILAATHRPIDDTAGSAFRQDLFYRLSVVLLRIPPLQPGDVLAIAQSLALEAMSRHGRSMASEDVDTLAAYCAAREWKGGVRELRNVVERFMVLWSPDRSMHDVVVEVLGAEFEEEHSGVRLRVSRPSVVKELECLVFLGIAEECEDVRELALRTERTVQAVYCRLKKLGLGPQDIGRTPALLAALHHVRARVSPEIPWIEALLSG